MKRSYVLAGASAIALATSLAAPSAQAFDRVWWDWTLDVDTKVDVNIDVDIKVDPSGAVISETDQYFKGTLSAEAVVKDVDNDPKGYYLDGISDLPEVTNVAAALGNSNSIQSEVSVQSDVQQTAIGTAYYGADLSATARVANTSDVSVSNAAQAIGNSNSITVDPATTGGPSYCYWCSSPNDQLIISNVEQTAYVDANAYASVYGVEVSGYDNLGSGDNYLNRPLVSNAAIAAGNINTITLVVGSIPTPDDVD
jgi:hypothetical protein